MKNEILKSRSAAFGLAIALLSIHISAQNNQDSITGRWWAEEMDQSVIEVAKLEDGSYEGVILSSSKEEFVGYKVIYDFNYDPNEKNYKGTISSAARKMELDGNIVLEEDGRLKITGKKLFMTRTFYWEREK